MRLNTPRHLQAWDRRLASIHEAGHLVVAGHLGIKSAEAWIAPVNNASAGDMKTWIGQCGFLAGQRRMSNIGWMKIAVAGHVAEQCWQYRDEAGAFPIFWEDGLGDPEAMSPADWAMADHTPGGPSGKLVRACEAVERVLMPGACLWPALLATSRHFLSRRMAYAKNDGGAGLQLQMAGT